MAEEGKTSISKASSYEEIGEFWDTHDLTDYLDDSQIVDLNTPDVRSSKIYFHVETDMAKKIRDIAKTQRRIRHNSAELMGTRKTERRKGMINTPFRT